MASNKAYLVVVLIQMIYAGMLLVSKAAFNVGMNSFVFVFYQQAAATVFLVPISLFFEWKTSPPLSFVILVKIFLLSLFGITLSLSFLEIALVNTSATLAAATSNSLPVITFFFALLLSKMEVMKMKTAAGKAKLIGIMACIGGVATLALLKGPHLRQMCHHHLFRSASTQHHLSSSTSWIKGCFFMIMSNIFWALWLVLQAGVLKSFPSKLLFTTLQCLFSSIQSFVIALCLARDPRQWLLPFSIRLVAVLYSGIMVTGVTNYLQAWVIEKKGPVFSAMSNPLNLVFTTVCSALLLCEIITTESVVGGLLLVVGLYCVLWGKSKEEENCKAGQVQKEGSELKQIGPKEQLPGSNS